MLKCRNVGWETVYFGGKIRIFMNRMDTWNGSVTFAINTLGL